VTTTPEPRLRSRRGVGSCPGKKRKNGSEKKGAKVFDVDQPVACAFQDCDDFDQLQLDRQRILVLRALNQEHHEERDDGRARVDHELPRIREAVEGPEQGPEDDDADRASEMPTSCRPIR
jgi:hypothetical protein